MFSNLKGDGPHLNGLVSNMIGKWSDATLTGAFCLTVETKSSHPGVNKIYLILTKTSHLTM